VACQEALSRGARLTQDEAIRYALGERRGTGDMAVDPAGRERAAAEPTTRAPDPLTRRERQVAPLIAEGLLNKQIAARLVISQRTVESHVENILKKLGFNSRAQIAVWVSQHGSAKDTT
jgi:non-specific serine/threonine protein kinase